MTDTWTRVKATQVYEWLTCLFATFTPTVPGKVLNDILALGKS